MDLSNMIASSLKGKYFNIAVDLCCGKGRYGEILKRHTNYLIGVDRNLRRLNFATDTFRYDLGVQSDVLTYQPPAGTQAVFMFEGIEHLQKDDGLALLNRHKNIPFTMLSTPVNFFKAGLQDHHVSLWTQEDFEQLGYKVSFISYDFPTNIMTGSQCMFVVREVN